jgi:MFS family permease
MGMVAGTSADRPVSAWAPLSLFPVFRALWIAQFVSNVGTWMQTVGAQWLLIDESPLLVSLVQTASSLPIVLLALPAGAWADLVDRKRLLLGPSWPCSWPPRRWPAPPSSGWRSRG